MIIQSGITIQDGTAWPIIVFMDIRSDRASLSESVRPKDVILFHWIRECHNRTLGAAPVVIHCIHILNIMAEGVHVDQIIAAVVLERVVMNLDARRSTILDNPDSSDVVSDDIVVIGNRVIPGYGLLQDRGIEILDDKAS